MKLFFLNLSFKAVHSALGFWMNTHHIFQLCSTCSPQQQVEGLLFQLPKGQGGLGDPVLSHSLSQF